MQRAVEQKRDRGGKSGFKLETTGERVVLVPAVFWREVTEFLERAYGKSVNLTLLKFAEEFGAKHADVMKGSGLSSSETLKEMAELASEAGWGRVEVGGDLEHGRSLCVDITNCAFCPQAVLHAGKKCDFMAGVALGVARTTFGEEYSCSNEVHWEGGEAHCTLCLERAPAKKGADWKKAVYFPWMI